MNLTSSSWEHLSQNQLFSGVKITVTDNRPTLAIDHEVYGKVVIRDGICVLEKWHQVLDRNMVLALKDTLIGRCAVKLVTYHRTDGHVHDSKHFWKRWFSLGDDLLLRSSNESYRGFKLIEPLCLNQLHIVASKERPLIPPYMNFFNHLEDLLSDKGVDLKATRDFISGLDNPYELNNIFCTFRLFMHPFIDFQAGLVKLNTQVNLDKNIDTSYAEQLASDLALRLIESHFQKRKQWPVDHNQMPEAHIFRQFV